MQRDAHTLSHVERILLHEVLVYFLPRGCETVRVVSQVCSFAVYSVQICLLFGLCSLYTCRYIIMHFEINFKYRIRSHVQLLIQTETKPR